MGITLEDVLEELREFIGSVEYFLQCIGYSATDIENMLGNLEHKLREANEETK